ncbi:hypothetical protein HUJ05_002917 [Dendroctonus ponderosae]|nr:hypothetical protein HUJ05_002917 [Dendroctonus ponderosae]
MGLQSIHAQYSAPIASSDFFWDLLSHKLVNFSCSNQIHRFLKSADRPFLLHYWLNLNRPLEKAAILCDVQMRSSTATLSPLSIIHNLQYGRGVQCV